MKLLPLTLFVTTAFGAGSAFAADTDWARQCGALKNTSIYQTRIDSAEWLADGIIKGDSNAALSGGRATDMQVGPHCVVRGEIEKRQGVDGQDYGIQFELRLPAAWNRKFLFQGGGGTNGVVSPALGSTPIRGSTAVPALQRGYAVVSQDSGHQGARDTRFAADQQARLDYAYASTGKTTAAAKQLIQAFYGNVPNKSYFMGCSNGGREAMMAAQRYPLEFDGIVAGNPGFRLAYAAVGEAWDMQQLMKIAPKNADGQKILANALTQADLDVVSQGVLARCDAKDGIADGLVNAWESCDFKPEMVQCKTGQKNGCISREKVGALKAIFGGAKNSRGENVYSSWPYDAGINGGNWRAWKLGSSQTAQANAINATMGAASLRDYYMTPPAPKDFAATDFNFDTDTPKIAQIAAINNADATFLTTFKQRGGKMIIVEGVSDPVFSAHDLRDWYRRLDRDMNGAADFARLFMIPGLTHCGGGPALDNVDPLTALENWTDKQTAPDFLAASGSSFPGKNQPQCAYPKYAFYVGGDKNAISSYVCR